MPAKAGLSGNTFESDIVMPMTFRFRLVPLLATAVVVAIGVSLGQWQVRRAHEKQAIEARLQERIAAPPLVLNKVLPPLGEAEYRRAVVKGEFVPDWPVYLDNRPYRGVAGFYVMMPLRIAGSDKYLLVTRGWVSRDPVERTRLPRLETPAGMIEIEGMVKRDPGHILQLGSDEKIVPGAIVQNLDPQTFASASNLPVLPYVLEQTSATADRLVRDWPRHSMGIEKHWGYAFQWYALAATALIFFIVTGFRRGTSKAEKER